MTAAAVSVTFSDGVTLALECGSCDGTGMVHDRRGCAACNGTGRNLKLNWTWVHDLDCWWRGGTSDPCGPGVTNGCRWGVTL